MLNFAFDSNLLPPQRSWGRVMFSQACVIPFTGEVCLSACWDTTPPRSRNPPKQAPPDSRHPPRAETSSEQAPLLEQTPPQQAALRSRPCWEIRSTRGRYASYWNAILFSNVIKILRHICLLTLEIFVVTILSFRAKSYPGHVSLKILPSTFFWTRPEKRDQCFHF